MIVTSQPWCRRSLHPWGALFSIGSDWRNRMEPDATLESNWVINGQSHLNAHTFTWTQIKSRINSHGPTHDPAYIYMDPHQTSHTFTLTQIRSRIHLHASKSDSDTFTWSQIKPFRINLQHFNLEYHLTLIYVYLRHGWCGPMFSNVKSSFFFKIDDVFHQFGVIF